jgi:transposase
MGTQLKNRIHAQLARCGITPDRRSAVFTKSGRAWLTQLPLRHTQRDVLERNLRLLDALTAETNACRASIEREARRDCDAQLLMTIPGVGGLTAMLFLAEVGDIGRFRDARHLASYAGLAPTVRSSAGRTQLGGIGHQGSAWLRWAFAEAAVHACAGTGPLAEFHRGIRQRRGAQTANVAMARKLLTIAYAVLKSRVPYHAQA